MNSTFASLRVLVVDDDEMQRELMLVHLFKLGITSCLAARDGREALELLRESGRTFDVVLTDNQMPEMDGPDLIVAIRGDARLSHVKLAMFSGNLTSNPLPLAAEKRLRLFLEEYSVIGTPKDDVSRATIERVLHELTGL